MKINKYHGVFFDTVFYLLVHFYKDIMIQRVFYLSDDLEKDLAFHDKVSQVIEQKRIIVPEEIKLFFYTNMDKAAFMNSFYRSLIDFNEDNYNAFFDIFTNRKLIKEKFFEYYITNNKDEVKILSEYKDQNNINRIVRNADLADEVKLDFYLFISNIDTNIDILINTIKLIIPIMESLHNENEDIFFSIISRLKNKNMFEKLIQLHKGNLDKPCILSFSLLNPFGIFFIHNDNYNYFKVGESFFVHLNMVNDKLNLYSLMKILGTNQKLNIFDLFLDYEVLSINDIAEINQTSYHAVQNFIDMFLSENLIYIAEKRSNEYFYSINKNYFDNYLILVQEFHEKFIKNNYRKYARYERKNKKR